MIDEVLRKVNQLCIRLRTLNLDVDPLNDDYDCIESLKPKGHSKAAHTIRFIENANRVAIHWNPVARPKSV